MKLFSICSIKNNSNITYRLSKYYSSTAESNNPIYDKHSIPDSGFTVRETGGALDKAWVGYIIAEKLENRRYEVKLYASTIQWLEKELKIEIDDFPDLLRALYL
jgi:hypothetical protein